MPNQRFNSGRVRAGQLAAASAFVVLAVVGAAWAWQASVQMSARVWGHHFKRVSIAPNGCKVVARLSYDAPEVAYKSRVDGMNHYRFKARVRLASGKVVTSQPFESSAAGKHTQVFSFDTASAGCWSKQRQTPAGVDVEGCRGNGCAIEPFKD